MTESNKPPYIPEPYCTVHTCFNRVHKTDEGASTEFCKIHQPKPIIGPESESSLQTIKTFGAHLTVGSVYDVVGHDVTSYEKDNMKLKPEGVIGPSSTWYVENIFGTYWQGQKIIIRSLDRKAKTAIVEVMSKPAFNSTVEFGIGKRDDLAYAMKASETIPQPEKCITCNTRPPHIDEHNGYRYWNCKECLDSRLSQSLSSSSSTEPTGSSQESVMNGNVYTGHVVVTKTIAAGEGVTTGIQSSEVVYTSKPFVAPNADAARAVILALAIVASAGEGSTPIDPTSPLTSVEVKLLTAS